MKVEIFSAINEFKKSQIKFETELRAFILELETDVKPGMVWVGFEGESKKHFIKQLQDLAVGIKDLNPDIWILKKDNNDEVIEVLKTDGTEVEEGDVENYIASLVKSFCKGDLSRKLPILSQLTQSHLYYDLFLKKYLNDGMNVSLKTTLPFQRLTRFTLLLTEIMKNSTKKSQKKCQKALEVVTSTIAITNQSLTSQIDKSRKIRQLDLERIEIRVKLTELSKTVAVIARKRRGIFRDRLKAPMQKLIAEVRSLLIAELRKSSTTNYTATMQSGIEILQGLMRHQGNGTQLREIGLPIISEILKSIRPLPPYQSRATKPSNDMINSVQGKIVASCAASSEVAQSDSLSSVGNFFTKIVEPTPNPHHSETLNQKC